MLPDFIIIGAMKCGTTSLYHYIASHREIICSSTKETNFFKTTDDFNKGIGWYQSLFKGDGKLCFEASPNYTKRHKFPHVPERMYSVLPKIKLIYLVRDPIERIISHYIHNYSHGREWKSFSDAVQEADSNYVQTSKYFFQIEAFFKYYSDRQLLVLELEQLNKNTANILNDIFQFLEIPADYDLDILQKKFHKSSKKKQPIKLHQKLAQKTKNKYLISTINKLTHPFKPLIKEVTLSEHDQEILLDCIAADTDKLKQYTGLSFANWSL